MSTDNDELDVSGFVRVCEDLSLIAGKDFRDVVVPQLAAVLRACVNYTPARTPEQIAKRISGRGGFVEFQDGTVVTTWKKLGGDEGEALRFFDDSTYAQYQDRWPKKTPTPQIGPGGKSWHNMNYRWSDQRWARFQAYDALADRALEEKYRRALDARGLAKKTWVQMAKDLGLDLRAPAYVDAAKHPKAAKEGFAREMVEQGVFIVEIVNRNPLLGGRLNGRAILQKALNAREGAFNRDLSLGVFDDMKRRIRRYPGVFTTG